MRAPPPLLSLMIEILNKHISSSALGIKKLSLYLPTSFPPALGLLSSSMSWACVICASIVVSHTWIHLILCFSSQACRLVGIINCAYHL